MPYFPAHPTAIIPFLKRFDPLGLVIGSLSPDFVYFLSPYFHQNGIDRSFTHGLWGGILFCLPISLLIYFISQLLLRETVLSLFNHINGARRLTEGVLKKIINIRLVLISIFIGYISHIFWDTLTHSYSWGALFITDVVQKIAGYNIPASYYVLFHWYNSIIGTVILLYFVLNKFSQKLNNKGTNVFLFIKSINIRQVSIVGILFLIAFIIPRQLELYGLTKVKYFESYLLISGPIVYSTLSFFFLEICMYSFVLLSIRKYLMNKV